MSHHWLADSPESPTRILFNVHSADQRLHRNGFFINFHTAFFLLTLLCCLFLNVAGPADRAHAQTDYNAAPINYQTAKTTDAVAKLARRIDSGETSLDHDRDHGYLKSILDELNIPVSSQTLVFSKTSQQIDKISPRYPRALYFNDDVYVGWCRNGKELEIIANDADQGPTFYALSQKPTATPKLIRDRGKCMSCHQSNRTQGVPGYFIRSVYPTESGHADLSRGSFTTGDSTPFSQRWGGWYVTGKHGDMNHMGNKIFAASDSDDLGSVADKFADERYLSPHSDIVALMVLQHQTQMHNAITFANFETRRALHQSYSMNKILDRPDGLISDSAGRRINAAAEKVVQQLLMCDEFPLTSSVSGTSGFTKEFEALAESLGQTDSQGRSLRQLDLKTRLFRYPCSYLIHSESFAELPIEVKRVIFERLNAVLENRDASGRFDHLADDDRVAIREILHDTKVLSDVPPLLDELKHRKDDLSFDSFVTTSTTEALGFRNRILKSNGSEQSEAQLIAAASVAFRERINQGELGLAPELKHDLKNFKLSASQTVAAIEGTRSLPDPAKFYGSFGGKWHGLWEQNEVDHHWSEYVALDQPLSFETPDTENVDLIGYQYAWVGDGYALNHAARSADGSRIFLLGYVVHIRDRDLEQEVIRRPHVGVVDGPNRLIWITKSEVFFEESFPADESKNESYCITGFRYRIDRNAPNSSTLIAKEAFQTIYARDENGRTPWRGFEFALRIGD